MTETHMRQFAESIHSAFEAFDRMNPAEAQQIIATAVAGQPVGLRDTAAFNLNIEVLSRVEVQETRRALTRAISLEKWVDGFIMALRLVSLCAGLLL